MEKWAYFSLIRLLPKLVHPIRIGGSAASKPIIDDLVLSRTARGFCREERCSTAVLFLNGVTTAIIVQRVTERLESALVLKPKKDRLNVALKWPR